MGKALKLACLAGLGVLVLSACTTQTVEPTSTSSSRPSSTSSTVGEEPVVPRVRGGTNSEPTYGSAVVDGNDGEWDLGSDFFADMYQAGKPDKPILSKLYVRYACNTGTLYVMIQAEPEWVVINSDDDNFVKLGNSNKLVDGSYGNDGTPPDFAYVPFEEGVSDGWEASTLLEPGSYEELNVHTQVEPRRTRSETSAVADRGIPITVQCDPTTTTTTPATTTTTRPATTTTTAPVVTSTTAPETTTTTGPVTTTTTAPVVTTTTVPETTTTTEPPEVSPTSEATTTSTIQGTLPVTGPGEPGSPLLILALALSAVAFGGLLVSTGRER